MEADNGIVDYLTQAALISQKALAQFSMLTKHNEQLGCKICSFGTADVSTLTDFSDDRVAGIIEALKPDSDVLIIETAPSGRQPDAVRMARHAEEVLVTFESGTSSDRSVDTLRDLFTEAGVKKMSMVLTNTLERVA
jgi:Mrp family chromosome partitioning ATPase